MLRAALLAIPLLLIPASLPASGPAPAPAPALLDSPSLEQSRTGESCQRRNRGRRTGGRIAGAIGRGLLGRVGGGAAANLALPMASMLGDAIMNLLDCREQEKAAGATEEVVERAEQAERGERGAVGTTASWESDTRPGVSGTSTVTAVETSGGQQCMTVTDVVIVDGEETTAPKRMCKRPPSNRYVRV